MKPRPPEPTAKYPYLWTLSQPATKPDNVYSYYSVARTYFHLPDLQHIPGDLWLITWFGTLLHYRNGQLLEQQPYPARQDTRFVWYLPAQALAPNPYH